MVICLGRGADLHMAQLMSLSLTVSCSNKSRLVFYFTFLVPAHPGSPRQSPLGRKTVVVVVVVVAVVAVVVVVVVVVTLLFT